MSMGAWSADAYFDRMRAHKRQCPKGCRGAKAYDDPEWCALGAAMVVAWLEAEVRNGNPHIRRVPTKAGA